MYKNSKQVLDYMAVNQELLQQNLPSIGPLIICGLPRSGSTLLYDLLACDPSCRAPIFTDMHIDPAPPIMRSDSVEHDRRGAKRKLAAQLTDQLIGQSSSTAASHPIFPIEQDQLVLQQAGFDIQLMMISPLHQTEMDNWFCDKINKSFAYAYHEIFLHMLNSVDAPHSHWLLKTPAHALFLDTLLCHYPRAHVVMTHRDVDEVLPSFCRFMWEINRFRLNQNDQSSKTTLITRCSRHIDKFIERIIEFRTHSDHLQTPIFDVTYDDLINDPIATVRRIYDHFNLHFSRQFEIGMSDWLHNNPQGKQGRHTYSLEEFGLVREDIEARYADYTNLFLRSST